MSADEEFEETATHGEGGQEEGAVVAVGVAKSVRSTGGFINASRWGMVVIRTIAVPNQEKEKHTHRSRAKRFLSGRILYL